MKRTILVLAFIAMASSAAFAEFGLGGAAFLKSPVLVAQPIDISNLNVNQFSFGADARFKLGWFQAEGLLLYSAGDVNAFQAYLDAGVALDIAMLRLSFGAGPNFSASIVELSPIQAGINAKIGADIVIGKVSFGLSYIMALNISNGIYVGTSSGLLGLQILFWI